MSSDRDDALRSYIAKVQEHRKFESGLKSLRDQISAKQGEFDKSESHIKALQSVGQIIGELLTSLGDEKYIVKASSGSRYVVTVRPKIPKTKLKAGARVALDMTTLCIMRILPREVDPMVFSMSAEDPGKISYNEVGGAERSDTADARSDRTPADEPRTV